MQAQLLELRVEPYIGMSFSESKPTHPKQYARTKNF